MPRIVVDTSKATQRRTTFNKRVQAVINRNLETKFTIQTYAGGTVIPSSPGLLMELTNITQGDTQNTRQGNQLHVTGIYGKFVFEPNATTVSAVPKVDYQYIVRAILFIPKNPTDNLSTLTMHGGVDKDRYNIMMDKYYNINFNGGSHSIIISKNFKKGGKKGTTVQYNGTAGNAYAKNPIHLLLLSNSSLATEQPFLLGNIRCYFKDA